MKILTKVCRLLFSITFILSGTFKLIDPVGAGLKVGEYLSFMHLDFLSGGQIWIGIILACVEFVTGAALLVGLKMRFFATAALCLETFFTLLTLYLALFNPISDCGCFGEAIHLTNMESFVKNLVLLLFAVLIFIGRKQSPLPVPDWLQWCFVAIFAAAALLLAVIEKSTIPHIDFTAYNSGTDINDVYSEGQAEYETSFVYEKNGVREEFTLENLPDSSWTFVDSKTTLLYGDTRMAQVDFRPHTFYGDFFAVSVYDREILEDPDFQKDLYRFRTSCDAARVELAVYTPQGKDGEYQSDRKSLMTLNRSNGGITYFSDGVIVKKWPRCDLDEIDAALICQEDPDVIILNQRISEQLFVSMLIAGMLVILLLLHYFCRIFAADEKITDDK